MSERSKDGGLCALDELFAASEAVAGSDELCSMAEKRFSLAEVEYGTFHVMTLCRLADYATQLSKSGNYRPSFDLFVDLKRRVSEGIHSHHPLYVQALLGMAFVYHRDGIALESSMVFEEASVRARRIFAKDFDTTKILEECIALCTARKDFSGLSQYLLLSFERGESSLDDLLAALEDCCCESEGSAGESEVESLLQGIFEEIRTQECESIEKRGLLKKLLGVCHTVPVVRELALLEALELYRGEEDAYLHAVVDLHSELATLYSENDAFELAREHYETALQYFNGRAEEESGESSTSRRLGELAYSFGKLEESKALLEESLKRSLEEAPENAETARLLHNLGTLAIADEIYEEAEGYLTNALQLKRCHCGPETAETQLTLIALGVLMKLTGDLPMARGYFHEALQIEVELFGTETTQYQSIQGEIEKLEQHAQEVVSEDMIEECVETVVEELPVEIPDAGFFRSSRLASPEKNSPEQEFRNGVLLLHQGKVEDAARHFEALLTEHPRNERIQQLVLENLADAYSTLGENNKAQECLQQLDSVAAQVVS